MAGTSEDPEGMIAHFELREWWASSFTADERTAIVSRVQPLGAGPDWLVSGRVSESGQSKLSFLSGVAAWLSKEETRHLAYAFLEAAEPLYASVTPPLDRHFGLHNRCQVYYRWRDADSFALPRAINACRRSIDMNKEAAKSFREAYPGPLPRHHCFQQLAVIEEKAGNFADAALLCDQAEAVGWGGDWPQRRARINLRWSKALKASAPLLGDHAEYFGDRMLLG